MAMWKCACGAFNALGLMRCPRAGCGQLSPQFAAAVPEPPPAVKPPVRRRRAA